MDVAGFSIALLSMVFFGLYMVPRKFSRLRDFDFVLSMCVGAVVTTQVARLIAHGGAPPDAPADGLWLAFICGPIWALGVLFYTLSVSTMGLALATPIKNTTAVLGTIFGLAIFAEWRETNAVYALVGSCLVVLCAVILARCGRCGESGPVACESRPEVRTVVSALGVLFALLAAVFFAAYTIPMRLSQQAGLDNYTLMAYMGMGTLVGGAGLWGVFSRGRRRWITEPLRDHLYAALAGCIWALATLTMSMGIMRIGLAVTWPVVNLNTIITVAVGVLLFKEISFRQCSGTISLAIGCALAGTVLLGLARM